MKILIGLLFCTSLFAGKFNEQDVRDFGAQVERGGLVWLAPRVDETIASIITRSTKMLADQGYQADADRIMNEYRTTYSSFVARNYNSRHQGDHKELVAFLTKVWDVVFEKLCGSNWGVAKALHISDLYSLNYTIPVVFQPCAFDLNGMPVERKVEYKRHFAKDDDERALYGLLPIVTYWAFEGACLVGTSGVGSILCGVAANLSEWFMGGFVAPYVSDKIFVASCGGN